MALNTKYTLGRSLEEYFVDKITGFPLAAGKVYFYSDINRADLKPIFTISGSPPDYSYIQLPNPVTLSSVGTFQDDDGNNVLPYYYPYDADGNVENYYIRVYSAGGIESGVFQFEREAFPNIGSNSVSAADNITNYIPNGQFKIHNDLELVPGETDGTVQDPITNIAQGGWTFNRPDPTSATDIVTFQRIGSYTISPTTSPRYAFRLQTTSPGSGDLFKDLRINFSDVNKFCDNDSLSNIFTFYFEGKTNVGTSAVLNLVLIKNFGTGGSATTQEIISEITLTNSYQGFNIPVEFGNNVGKTIGTLNDDTVSLALRFPNNPQDINLVNFALVPGDVALSQFPDQTDADMRTRGIAGWMPTPAYDRNDLGLPLILSETGLAFDHSQVGKIYADVSLPDTDQSGLLLCDGSQIDPYEYGENGAPYSRLLDKIGVVFGNGKFFAEVGTLISDLPLKNNTPGAATSISDGSIPTGFTFGDIAVGATTYGIQSFLQVPTDFVIWNNAYGDVTPVDVGTSGFSITSVIREGSTLTQEITQLRAIAATTLAGKYISFQIPGTTDFYLWYKVNGSGSDPAPGGTGILVNLISTDDAYAVAWKTWIGLSGSYGASIRTVAASAMTAGCYFNFNVLGGSTTAYYVWYTKNGVGDNPAPSGRSGIKVEILSTDNASQVLQKTHDVLQYRYYSLPDLRGMGLRGFDPDRIYDAGIRFNTLSGANDNLMGTYELDSILSHRHPTTIAGGPLPQSGSDTHCFTTNPPTVTGYAGQQETVGYNAAVNFFIKY